jgi:tripartite-type tricarboxylate transporter receptor subunit TctC
LGNGFQIGWVNPLSSTIDQGLRAQPQPNSWCAPPGGYTLLATLTSNFINATLYQTLPYNFIRDIEPVASLNQTTLVMEVNPSVPVRTVSEFINYAKARPGKINMTSGACGRRTV